MPIHRGTDKAGTYYQYGGQKKYYYTPNNKTSRAKAKNKAQKQAAAIKISQSHQR